MVEGDRCCCASFYGLVALGDDVLALFLDGG